jgi:hypothetical protein
MVASTVKITKLAKNPLIREFAEVRVANALCVIGALCANVMSAIVMCAGSASEIIELESAVIIGNVMRVIDAEDEPSAKLRMVRLFTFSSVSL